MYLYLLLYFRFSDCALAIQRQIAEDVKKMYLNNITPSNYCFSNTTAAVTSHVYLADFIHESKNY